MPRWRRSLFRASPSRHADVDVLFEQVGGEAVQALRTRYADFGATLASEKLREIEGVWVSKETIRQIQIRLGLWRPGRRRAKKIFQVRERRPRFRELIQIDGSPHDWFEGRGALRREPFEPGVVIGVQPALVVVDEDGCDNVHSVDQREALFERRSPSGRPRPAR